MSIFETANRISTIMRIMSFFVGIAFIGWVVYAATAPSRMADGLIEIEQNAAVTVEGIMQQQREIVRDTQLAEDGWGTSVEPIDRGSDKSDISEGGGWAVN